MEILILFIVKLMSVELRKKRPIFYSADALFCPVPSDAQREPRLPAYKQGISILSERDFTHSFQHQTPPNNIKAMLQDVKE